MRPPPYRTGGALGMLRDMPDPPAEEPPCTVCGGMFCAGKVHGEISYRRSRRVVGPIDYTFPSVGGWARKYNQRKKPRATCKAKRQRK